MVLIRAACNAPLAVFSLLLVLSLFPASDLHAQSSSEEIRIGYLLSRRGGFNTHDRAGAMMGVEEVNQQAKHLGKRFAIRFAVGGRSSEVVKQAIRLIEEDGVRALMSSVSDAATIALANLAQERGLVFFNVGSPVESLRKSKCRINSFSIAPSLTMEVRALGQWIVYNKGWKRWAVIEGDSRTERRLSAAAQEYIRANAGEVAGVIPVGDEEAYAPQAILQRLREWRPEFVFVALMGERQVLVLDGYKRSGLVHPIGGALPELARFDRRTSRVTGYWSTGWSHLQRRYGASELNNRFADFAGLRMEERSWAAWAGVKILGEAMLRVDSPTTEALVAYLRESVEFDGYKGVSMNFRNWNHQLRQPMQVVQVNERPERNNWDTLIPVGRVPLRGLKGWRGNPLDSIGLSPQESGCRW